MLTPEEDVNNEAIVTRDTVLHVNWVWKPQATASKIKRRPYQNVFPKFGRWEHVAFVFNIPDDWKDQFAVVDPCFETELDDTKSYYHLIIKITISEKKKNSEVMKKGENSH